MEFDCPQRQPVHEKARVGVSRKKLNAAIANRMQDVHVLDP